MRYLLTLLAACASCLGFEPSLSGTTPGAKLIEWTFSEGSGQTVFNKLSGIPTASNLLSAPEQAFNRTQFWSKSGTAPTITDYYTNAPNGSLVASRFVSTSGGVRHINQGALTMANVQHTFSLYVKSNTGADQTMRLAYNDGVVSYSADQTVTTNWARISYTFTPTAGINLTVYIHNDAAATALDISIWGAKLETGASATAYLSNWNSWFGTRMFTDSADPAWSATNTVSYQGSKYTYAQASVPVSVTNCTVYAACRWSGTPVFANYAPILYTPDNGRLIGLAGSDANANLEPSFSFNNNKTEALLGNLNDSLWHVVAASYDGATTRIWIDGAKVAEKSVGALSPISLNSLLIGNFNFTAYWPGEISYGLFYTAAHSQNYINYNTLVLKQRLASRGVAINTADTFTIFEGDSNTAVTGGQINVPTNYTFKVVRAYSPARQGQNVATSGATISTWQTRAAAVDSYRQPGRTNVLVVLGGNDLIASGAAQWFADFKAYCEARQSAGWKVVAQTILPRTTVGFNTQRATANTSIRNDTSFYDALADGAADSTIGEDADASDTTYYSDGVHMTATAHDILDGIVKAAIDALP